MKGRNYEEIYGPEKAAELRASRSLTGSKGGKANKGKTYIEIYGPEKAAELIKLRAAHGHHLTDGLRGKTYEEIHGPVKARKLRTSRGRKGPANNLWRGGMGRVQMDRGPTWPIQRKKALKRDGYRCRHCDKRARLDVHHITPYRFKKSNALRGLISLCRSCHLKADRLWSKEHANSFT